MEPFKNNISPELVACIAIHMGKHLDKFDRKAFEKNILARLPDLELKQRAEWIADQMYEVLPRDIRGRNDILIKMLHPVAGTLKDGVSDENGIRAWGMLPLGMVVGKYGLEDFEGSLLVLKEMTKRFSSEFDVRFFIQADQERALSLMASWADDPCYHVRRLLSEGTRPRLPWGMQLKRLVADPTPMLPLLEKLRDDPEEYVRRSVANHLNDIAKDHPDLVADLANNWMVEASKQREKLVRHACRSLIKQGNPKALQAFGVGAPKVDLTRFIVESQKVEMGGSVKFVADITSTHTAPQALVIDYIVHFRKASGKLVGKVFKGTKTNLKPGETLTFSRSHPLRVITTRRYYDGTQGLSLRINGEDFGYGEFALTGCPKT